MKQERLPGCAFRVILFSVFVALFIIYGLLSCTPKAHSIKIENYTVSVDTCPVYQEVKHPRKHSKWLHPEGCNRAKQWEAPGPLKKPKKQ